MSWRIELGDIMDGLPLGNESVQCCVTSPPYWGAQRDYGMPGQLGMEATPEEFVARLVEAFRHVRRALRDDGCLWINMGDSYAASGKGGGGKLMKGRQGSWGHREHLTGWRNPPPGYKQKDLVGVPWLMATALRQDGWYLRRDIVWNKRRASEPVRADRPCGSHEFVFLFSKTRHYYFDAKRLTGLVEKGWLFSGAMRKSRKHDEKRCHPVWPAVPRTAIERLRHQQIGAVK